MVRVICPKCGRKGSLQPHRRPSGTYWGVFHSGEGRARECYLGRGPHEVAVIKDEREPVRTEVEEFA